MELSKPRIVIIGAGFAGLSAVKKLRKAKADVILIERTNHHLFQPLLYQVASSALSPANIAFPVRTFLREVDNTQVIMNEVISIDKESQKVFLKEGEIDYDYLIVATGARHSYFGNDDWEKYAPGLKDLNDALRIRENMLASFEKAERYYKTANRNKYLTFFIVGGGPTGVELAGAISEIARKTMLPDFPKIKNEDIRVILADAGDKILSTYPDELSQYSKKALEELGVEVELKTMVTDIGKGYAETSNVIIETSNIIWAAGNEASPLLQTLDLPLEKSGQIRVNSDLTVNGYDNLFVIGDSAKFLDPASNEEIPTIATSAIQMGEYVGKIIYEKIPKKKRSAFKYKDKGAMATIGKAKAIAYIKGMKFKGTIAWLLWSLVHVFFLIGYRNKFRVLFEWMWYYITNKPGTRLIVHKNKSKRNIDQEAKK